MKMTTHANLRIAVFLVTCFVTAINPVHGGPIQLANYTWRHTTEHDTSSSETELDQLSSSSNQTEKPMTSEDANRRAEKSMSSATIITMTPLGESVTSSNNLYTSPPRISTELPNKLYTEQPGKTTNEPFVIIATDTFTDQNVIKSNNNPFDSLQHMDKLVTSESISAETTMVSEDKKNDPVTVKVNEKNYKDTEAIITTSTESSRIFTMTGSEALSREAVKTRHNTDKPFYTTAEVAKIITTVVIESKAYEQHSTFTTTEVPKSTTTDVTKVTFTEIPDGTSTDNPKTTTKVLMTTTSKVLKLEPLTGLNNKKLRVKALNMNAETDNISTNITTNDTVSKTMIAEMLNITPENEMEKDKYQRSLLKSEEMFNASLEYTNTSQKHPIDSLFEKHDIDTVAEISKERPIVQKNLDKQKSYQNVETNEIDKIPTTYLPVRKQYTAIERKKASPLTEVPASVYQNLATEAATKASKKHMNVWVADLKLSDGDMELTSIPRNPTSTMYPTMTYPTTTVASVVSRRAGYINNSPSPVTVQDIEKQPSSTNPVRASNPILTDTFPIQPSVLDLSTTHSSYTPTAFFNQSTVTTAPVTLTKQTLGSNESTIFQIKTNPTTTLQENYTTQSIDSDKSKLPPYNFSGELPVYMETDVLPLSPSQSHHMRLVDDALKEEFMKEMSLNLNKKLSDLNKIPDESIDDDDTITSPASATNVTEKGRNFTLYKVNPNYKPLKRLDIQPSKQFTIDPDDNSWRNESINSRGIVFKAKNSSIVFTQVLKNKTESELNNTKLLNKDNKDEQPELRERLEKIAEKRKYKKKYNTSSAVPEEIGDATTTAASPQEEKIQPKTKTLEPPTTDVAPFHKVDDVYDSREDEDEDDEQLTKLTQHDILRASLTPIEPAPTYFPPNRKGTVQYFPPRPNGDQIKYSVNFFATENSVPHPRPYKERTTMKKLKSELDILKEKKSLGPFDPKLRRESVPEDVSHGAYVIKHYRDFLRQAAADAPDERKVLDNVAPKAEVLHKIVENFNKNSEQLKVDFPVLYNTSVEHGRYAASRTWQRRVQDAPRPGSYLALTKPYDASCENLTVELNPAYELHYYVPDQEERQDAALPDPYRFDHFHI